MGRESPYAVPAPGAMTGNTDARYYQSKSMQGRKKTEANIYQTCLRTYTHGIRVLASQLPMCTMLMNVSQWVFYSTWPSSTTTSSVNLTKHKSKPPNQTLTTFCCDHYQSSHESQEICAARLTLQSPNLRSLFMLIPIYSLLAMSSSVSRSSDLFCDCLVALDLFL